MENHDYKTPGTYPFSRAATFTSGFFNARAAQHRKNKGSKPLTKAEEIYLSGIEPDGRRYPISAALTSPSVSAGLGAMSGLGTGYLIGASPMQKLILALGSAGASGLTTAYLRDTAARAALGQANTGKKGITRVRAQQLEQLRAKGPLDTNRTDRKEMLNQNLGLYAASTGAGLIGTPPTLRF